MNEKDLVNLVLGDHERIATAVSAGAAWEIWMQVELLMLLQAQRVQCAREVPYPSSAQKADILASHNGVNYVIELKVESATNAGPGIAVAVSADIQKLKRGRWPTGYALWVCAIAYSVTGREALKKLAPDLANIPSPLRAYGADNGRFSCLVTNAR